MFSHRHEGMLPVMYIGITHRGPARVIAIMLRAIIVFMLLSTPLALAHDEEGTRHDNHPPKSLDPMNRPMDELGVTGHDTTLCSDRWYSCTTYDRQQFDQKYPGQPLNELLRYGEPNWPDRDRSGLRDSLDQHDRLDKDGGG